MALSLAAFTPRILYIDLSKIDMVTRANSVLGYNTHRRYTYRNNSVDYIILCNESNIGKNRKELRPQRLHMVTIIMNRTETVSANITYEFSSTRI